MDKYSNSLLIISDYKDININIPSIRDPSISPQFSYPLESSDFLNWKIFGIV